MVLFVECVFSKGFYIALGEVFYYNRNFLLVQYSVEASPLLITLTRKTLSSWFLEDWISVFSIFSVPCLKFTAFSVSVGSFPQRSSVSMSDCSLISK